MEVIKQNSTKELKTLTENDLLRYFEQLQRPRRMCVANLYIGNFCVFRKMNDTCWYFWWYVPDTFCTHLISSGLWALRKKHRAVFFHTGDWRIIYTRGFAYSLKRCIGNSAEPTTEIDQRLILRQLTNGCLVRRANTKAHFDLRLCVEVCRYNGLLSLDLNDTINKAYSAPVV